MVTTATEPPVRSLWALRQEGAWLDAAFQGPLPRRAIEALHRAGELKASPERMLERDWFEEAPRRLRARLADFLGVLPDEVILGNSTSWGLHLLAWGYPWIAGDEVVVVSGDFPANRLPWSTLAGRGVVLRFLHPRAGALPSAGEVEEAITPRTRVLCASWVHTFTGEVLDVNGISEVCGHHDVRFVLNASQALGAIADAPGERGVDAVVGCGWKWLCGPYGTGYAWFAPALLERLDAPLRYWRTEVGMSDLVGPSAPPGTVPQRPAAGRSPRRFDTFAAASFFNVLPWAASLEVLLEIGLERVARRSFELATRLRLGLPGRYVTTPVGSPMVVVGERAARTEAWSLERLHGRLARAGVHASLRGGRLRFAPHAYNDESDVDRALEVLHERA